MKRPLLAGIAVLGIVVSACSSGGATPSPSAAATESPSAAATASSSAAAASPSAAPSAAASAPAVGQVEKGQSGSADSLTLTDAEKATVKSVANGRLVGIIAATMATQYHQDLNNTAKADLEALGFTVDICDTQTGDAAKAVTCFEGFVQRKAYAIITAASQATVGSQATQAIANGTIVIQVTGLDLGAVGAVSISVDNIAIGAAEGTAAGQYAAKTYPNATSVGAIILDYPSLPDLVARADAIQTAMIKADPSVKVLARLLGGLPANGATSMEQANTKYGKTLQIVTGINDGGNLGAYSSAQKLGRTASDLAFFGIDCDPAAVTAIDAGTMYKGCVDTNPKGTGELAANAIGMLTAGQNVAGTITVPVSVHGAP
jgi:ABC-type sugar transport system substrate-binding protein